MTEWLTELEPNWGTIAWTATLATVGVGGSVGISAWVLVRLPPDWFGRPTRDRFFRYMASPWRELAWVGKNLLGVLVVLIGVLLSVPGVPGQGLLTVLLGLMLLDFPGRARVELALLRQRQVGAAITRLRARFGKPPFELPPVV